MSSQNSVATVLYCTVAVIYWYNNILKIPWCHYSWKQFTKSANLSKTNSIQNCIDCDYVEIGKATSWVDACVSHPSIVPSENYFHNEGLGQGRYNWKCLLSQPYCRKGTISSATCGQFYFKARYTPVKVECSKNIHIVSHIMLNIGLIINNTHTNILSKWSQWRCAVAHLVARGRTCIWYQIRAKKRPRREWKLDTSICE